MQHAKLSIFWTQFVSGSLWQSIFSPCLFWNYIYIIFFLLAKQSETWNLNLTDTYLPMCTSPINPRLCNTAARLFGLVKSFILRDGNWNFFSSVVITGCYCNWYKMLLKIISGIIIFLLELFHYVTFVKTLYKIQGDLLCNVIFKFKKEKEKVITGCCLAMPMGFDKILTKFLFLKFHMVVYQL